MDRVREKDRGTLHGYGPSTEEPGLKVLILDNYDSFVYNLAQYAGEFADEVVVKRNDEGNIPAVRKFSPDKIIISPGPGTPADHRYFGICTEVLRKVSIETPTLGVCLGHQGIVHSFGGGIVGNDSRVYSRSSRKSRPNARTGGGCNDGHHDWTSYAFANLRLPDRPEEEGRDS